MNANTRNGHQQITATQVLVSTGSDRAKSTKKSILVAVGRCLIAPAVVAVLMLCAQSGVYKMASAAEALAVEVDGGAEQYFPAEYAFRAADFDDPSNFR